MYSVKQSTTTQYILSSYLQCERLNYMLHDLIKTLSKEHKSDWPLHLPSLVFAYTAHNGLPALWIDV